jgi:hypothetical protein
MIKADFHIHTVLSPCGDIEMTPAHIIERAVEAGLSVIGITDHNTTLQAGIIKELGKERGIFVLTGAEVTTKEEIHMLVFADGDENLAKLEDFLRTNILKIPNKPEYFGYQLYVDVNENVLGEVDYLLINAVDKSIDEIILFAENIGAIVIPAHINKSSNSIFSQLGFLPDGINADALEAYLSDSKVLFNGSEVETGSIRIITSSDAHRPEDIGRICTYLDIDSPITFQKIKESLHE